MACGSGPHICGRRRSPTRVVASPPPSAERRRGLPNNAAVCRMATPSAEWRRRLRCLRGRRGPMCLTPRANTRLPRSSWPPAGRYTTPISAAQRRLVLRSACSVNRARLLRSRAVTFRPARPLARRCRRAADQCGPQPPRAAACRVDERCAGPQPSFVAFPLHAGAVTQGAAAAAGSLARTMQSPSAQCGELARRTSDCAVPNRR